MNMPAETQESRKLRSIARRYERGGYRVTLPQRADDLPAFLRDFTPDLIAESESDRVVIEVKASDAVRGANELREMAERVSREPGWRFELVTIRPRERPEVPSSERLASTDSRVRQAMSVGLSDLAYVYASAALEELLNDLALQHGWRAARTSFGQNVRELVSMGIVSPEMASEIGEARAVRNRLVHAENEPPPPAAEVEAVLALGRRLRDQLAAHRSPDPGRAPAPLGSE